MNLCPKAPWRSVGEWVLLLLILASRVECQMVHFNCSGSWNLKRYLIYCFYHMNYRKEEGPDSNGNLPFLGNEQFLPHFLKISQHTLLLEIKFHPFFLGLLRPWKRFQRTVSDTCSIKSGTWPTGIDCVVWTALALRSSVLDHVQLKCCTSGLPIWFPR